MTMNKLTEDQTVKILMNHLELENWSIESFCLGQTRGYDIVASRNNKKLFVEVKGAKASDNSPTKKREFFDSGQLKSHFGRAIIKTLETKHSNPSALVAIAHPDDDYIRKVLGKLIQDIQKMDIIHFWVNKNGKVTSEN